MFTPPLHISLWSLLLIGVCFILVTSFEKVLVPSIYNEYRNGNFPDWITSAEVKARYKYSTFLYQKHDPSAPNYIAHNRGTEAGVYLRYIVDHYHNFPDIAVFVHAKPQDHNGHWLDWLGCVRKNATYMSLNDYYLSRDTDNWRLGEHGGDLWVEQCWRQVLKIVWGLEDNLSEFNKLVPIDHPISVNFSCCQQFVMSRKMVHERPLDVWKKLLLVIGEQPACVLGEPDYENLYAYYINNKQKVGPEPEMYTLGDRRHQLVKKNGVTTQGGAMEHLAHVVYGHHPLVMPAPTMTEICNQFHPESECGFESPCKPIH